MTNRTAHAVPPFYFEIGKVYPGAFAESLLEAMAMKTDDHELLFLLRKELAFLQAGGYRHPEKAPWRPGLIFEDSPTCPNYSAHAGGPRKTCGACPLARFIPLRSQNEGQACRQIRLTPDGQTLRYLYQWGSTEEIESLVGNWLRRNIYRLEWEVEAKERFLQPAALSNSGVIPTGTHEERDRH